MYESNGMLPHRDIKCKVVNSNLDYRVTYTMGNITLLYGEGISRRVKCNHAIAFRDADIAIKIANELIEIANMIKRRDRM